MSKKNLKELFQESFDSLSKEDLQDIEAQKLAMGFLSLIDSEMDNRKIKKRELAEKVGTSAAYITQLFRGDRLPNFKILAKMKEALNLDFVIRTKEMWEKEVHQEILDYHDHWTKTNEYFHNEMLEKHFEEFESLAKDSKNQYAMAS